MSEYEDKVNAWLAEHGITFNARNIGNEQDPWQDGRDDWHAVYTVTFKRGGAGHAASSARCLRVPKFYQSVFGTERGEDVSAYDVLACLTKYDPGAFEDFCSDLGYDPDSRKAERTYHAVVREWERVEAFFSEDELDELQEIAQ